MLTKIILKIDGIAHELDSDCLKNWGDVKCTYKREDYDGIVRAFTSKFEFVREAYDLILDAYIKNRYEAKGEIEIYTLTNQWGYEKSFSCPLDFTSISWDNNTVSINGYDNTFAAIIKSNKSTKYEFKIGKDITPTDTFHFDRIPMQESVTYEVTDGESFDDCADLYVTLDKGKNLYVGTVGDEMVINRAVDWNDDQTDEPDSYLLTPVKDIVVNLDYEVSWRCNYGETVKFNIAVKRNGSIVQSTPIATLKYETNAYFGSYPSLDDLLKAKPTPTANLWAIVDGIVWASVKSEGGFEWKNTDKSKLDYFYRETSGQLELNLLAGDKVVLDVPHNNTTHFRLAKSKFVFKWRAIGDAVDIQAFTPKRVGETIVKRMADGRYYTAVDIDKSDPRIANTCVIAAESLRGMANPKLYTSFKDYCEWMSTVFGYVYYITGPEPSRFRSKIMTCGQYEYSPWDYSEGDDYYGTPYPENIVYFPTHAKFLFYDGSKLYARWPGSSEYNDPYTGHPRTDTLFRINELSESKYYYFDKYNGQPLMPQVYDDWEENIGQDVVNIHFVPRHKLLNSDAPKREITDITDFKCSPDTGQIFSELKIGYNAKDYDSVNGRDEFNFNNTYTSGVVNVTKTLSLISGYRADCYGIEFATQKRGKDTTDKDSDKDVFFVLCTRNNEGNLTPDRTITVTDALSDKVFNAAFSPLACIKANEGYIGMQAPGLTLKFASSAGNSTVSIDDVPINSDIQITGDMVTCDIAEFTTPEIEVSGDFNDLIEVYSGGKTYRGYIQELDIKYARPEGAKYKLLVKDITI